MRSGVRQAALEHGHPADVGSAPSSTRGQRITFGRLLARTAGYEIRLARDAAGTVLAAKCVRAAARPAWAEALEREHAWLSRLRAPNIVATAGLIETRAGPALLLEHLGGGDLVSLAGFDARHWLGPVREVAAGLGYLHTHGIVHRDVKARNVRFAADGRACLIDFGSAADVGAQAGVAGTTAAHARRGVEPRRVTPADDVHAFAVLVYELMTGRLPYGPEPGAAAEAPAPIAAAAGLDELAALVMRTLEGGRDREAGGMAAFERIIGATLDEQAVRT